MLRDVIKYGTGRRALSLSRNDIAGKTGTTNDQRDAWFSGFNENVVTTVWVGFDKFEPLGRKETGARSALPIWISFMKDALAGTEDRVPERPEGLISALIDKKTGALTNVDNPDKMYEFFRPKYLPKKERGAATGGITDSVRTCLLNQHKYSDHRSSLKIDCSKLYQSCGFFTYKRYI